MSKRYNIRWTQDDNRKLELAVKRFNAKVDYWAKKDPKNKNALPEKVTVKGLKNLIDTRQDLNRELNALARFSKKGAEEIITVPNTDYNLKTTKWQYQEMTRRAGVINRRRKKKYDELKDLEVTSGGKSLGYTRAQIGMGKKDKIYLEPVNVTTLKMNQTDFFYKFKQLQNESRDKYYQTREEILKENYIKGIKENYNTDDPRVKEIIEKIEKMGFKEFYKIFNQEDPHFEFASDLPKGANMEAYTEHLYNSWMDRDVRKRRKKIKVKKKK